MRHVYSKRPASKTPIMNAFRRQNHALNPAIERSGCRQSALSGRNSAPILETAGGAAKRPRSRETSGERSNALLPADPPELWLFALRMSQAIATTPSFEPLLWREFVAATVAMAKFATVRRGIKIGAS